MTSPELRTAFLDIQDRMLHIKPTDYNKMSDLMRYMRIRKIELTKPEADKLQVNKLWISDCLKKADELGLNDAEFIVAYIQLMLNNIMTISL